MTVYDLTTGVTVMALKMARSIQSRRRGALRSTNIVEFQGLTGTNASFIYSTNQLTLLTNIFPRTNASFLDGRRAMRFGGTTYFAVSNAVLVATNQVTGKLQTNVFIDGILMDTRSEAY